MSKLIAKFRRDEKGAAFIEYTVLLGIILAVSIVTVGAVGTWANTKWVSLNTAVNPAP
ncbi:Flp family type IVb pilin [Prosthecomicrobium sp. N25]|uniref:Flp family type IVb pilin n=1 Tax=Prosthecomicrobium sp. N25 TaxID=3129254 RepID=UPI003076B39A